MKAGGFCCIIRLKILKSKRRNGVEWNGIDMIKKSISCKTYAKINLSLDVTGVRDNGYHEVAMVMQGIDLYDEMRVRVFPADEHKITLKTDKYFIPTDARNTAYKAAQLMIEECGLEPMEIRIDIKKTIPVAAGLAGGSSNAAGVIMALNAMLELGLDLKKMCELGQKIGADVPFSMMTMAAAEPELGVDGGATCALAEGIGEVLTPLRPVDFWVTLAKPPIAVSTPFVYKWLDEVGEYGHPDTEKVLEGVRADSLEIVAAGMGNVLENVTLQRFHEVMQLKEQLRACAETAAPGAPTMMSGSGPTVYSLFNDRESAEAAETALRNSVNNKKTDIFCVKTI